MIGTAAAIIGASLIGAGASALSSHSTSSAAQQTAAENNAVQRDIYNSNKEVLNPFVSTGAAANNQLASLVGTGSGTGATGASPGVDWNAYLQANPDVQANYNANKAVYEAQGESPQAFAARHYAEHGKAEGRALPSTPAPTGQGPSDAGFSGFLDRTGLAATDKQIADATGSSYQDYLDKSGLAPVDTQQAGFLGVGAGGFSDYLTNSGVKPYNDAIDHFLGVGQGGGGLDTFLKSTGYQFNLDQGQKAIERSNAAKGLRLSGAAIQDATKFAEGTAQSYGQAYLSSLGQVAGQREGQGINYNTALGQLASRRGANYQDYTQNKFGLATLQGNQLGQYAGITGDIASRGLSAGGALAGVGTGYASNVSANNNTSLEAKAGANASAANSFNGLLGNALGALAYSRGASGWNGSAPQSEASFLQKNGWS
jgi:hypothetical protein